MKWNQKAAALLMSAAVFSLSGCSLFPEEEEALAPPLKEPAAVTYTTTTVERGTIVDSVTVSGTFISTSTYDMSFEKRSGYLSEITVKAGDTVTAGQMLARLDTDELESEIQKQKLAVERAQIALDIARAAEGATADSIRLAEIDYELQKIQLDEMQTELEKQCIYAPIDGVVSYISSPGIGEYVAARSTLMRIVDPTSLDKTEHAGKVVMTSADSPSLAMEKGEPFVRVEITNPLPEGDLLGESVTVELIREEKQDVLILPRNVVSLYSGESYVQVLEDGVKKERVIETGIKTVTEIEVVSGLEEGEEVIIK